MKQSHCLLFSILHIYRLKKTAHRKVYGLYFYLIVFCFFHFNPLARKGGTTAVKAFAKSIREKLSGSPSTELTKNRGSVDHFSLLTLRKMRLLFLQVHFSAESTRSRCIRRAVSLTYNASISKHPAQFILHEFPNPPPFLFPAIPFQKIKCRNKILFPQV